MLPVWVSMRATDTNRVKADSRLTGQTTKGRIISHQEPDTFGDLGFVAFGCAWIQNAQDAFFRVLESWSSEAFPFLNNEGPLIAGAILSISSAAHNTPIRRGLSKPPSRQRRVGGFGYQEIVREIAQLNNSGNLPT